MIDLKYSNAFTEVLEILKYVSKEDYEKVPLEMIEIMEDNCSKDYFVEYNPNISLTDQKISEEAQTIIAIFFRDYWATPYQKERIEAKEKYDLEKLEEEKREKYNPGNIFKNRQENIIVENTNLPIEIKEKSFLKKMINFIKKFLKI